MSNTQPCSIGLWEKGSMTHSIYTFPDMETMAVSDVSKIWRFLISGGWGTPIDLHLADCNVSIFRVIPDARSLHEGY